MVISSQLSTTESKKQTKQTISTGTESDMEIICRLSVGKGKDDNGGEGAGITKYKLVGIE